MVLWLHVLLQTKWTEICILQLTLHLPTNLQMNFAEAIPHEDFNLQLTDSEPSFSVTLQDVPFPASP